MGLSRQIVSRFGGIVCVLMMAALCFVAIYDVYSPWPTASEALMRLGRHYRFCVGMGWESSTTIAAGQTTFKSSKQRAFVLIRAPIDWPKMVIVSEDQDGRVTVDQTVFGFCFWLAATVGIAWGAWCWCIRLLFKRPTSATPT